MIFTLKSTTEERKKLYDNQDDFTFPIVNFPFISSNIPAAPAYGFIFHDSLPYSGAIQSSAADAKATQKKATVLLG